MGTNSSISNRQRKAFQRSKAKSLTVTPGARTVIVGYDNNNAGRVLNSVNRMVTEAVAYATEKEYENEKSSRKILVHMVIPKSIQTLYHLHLSARQRELIPKYWRLCIAVQRRDIFHKVMLCCIEASPKLNEIIACGRFCYRDLTKWPKLNKMCQAQFSFYERLIFEHELNGEMVEREAYRLGRTHAEHAQYGLKPHFLDLFQQQFAGLLRKMDIGATLDEKLTMVDGYGLLTGYIIDIMNFAYAQRVAEIKRSQQREK